MPGQVELELEFGDGDYLLALRLPQIIELQRLCDAGIFVIHGRVLKGRYSLGADGVLAVPSEGESHVLDIYETIRLALIGGGQGSVNGAEVKVNALRARQLVETYCHTQPLKDSWEIAASILHALIEGYEGQKKSPEPRPAKKPSPASKRRKSSQTAP